MGGESRLQGSLCVELEHLRVAGVCATELGLGDVPQSTTQNASLKIRNFWCGLWIELNYLRIVPVEEIATRVV